MNDIRDYQTIYSYLFFVIKNYKNIFYLPIAVNELFIY